MVSGMRRPVQVRSCGLGKGNRRRAQRTKDTGEVELAKEVMARRRSLALVTTHTLISAQVCCMLIFAPSLPDFRPACYMCLLVSYRYIPPRCLFQAGGTQAPPPFISPSRRVHLDSERPSPHGLTASPLVPVLPQAKWQACAAQYGPELAPFGSSLPESSLPLHSTVTVPSRPQASFVCDSTFARLSLSLPPSSSLPACLTP